MVNANQRARNIAVEAVNSLCREGVFKIVWDTVDADFKKRVVDKIAAFAEQELMEYAGNRPLEPKQKLVLIYPENVWANELYLKEARTGVLTPVKLVKLTGEESLNFNTITEAEAKKIVGE